MNGGAKERADALKQEILSAESRLTRARKFYYVSADGNDSCDGTSPDKAIKSLTRVMTLPLRAGDKVLFRRGDLFRVQSLLRLQGGVGYGAYGTGDKPKLYGSLRNYAEELLWSDEGDGLWKLSLPYEQAGVMTMNHDSVVGFRKLSLEKVVNESDFYHDVKEGVLYLRCSYGNPGAYYQDIEIGTMPTIFYGANVNYVDVDNLCMKYASTFAIDFGNNKKISVTNCEIGWIGGAIARDNILYGNGVQFWYRAFDVRVEKCWFYQVFDAAVTFQGDGPENTVFSNVTFKDNLIEMCSMNIECWAKEREGFPCEEHDIYIQNNIVRFGGYGWGGIQRPDKGDQALFLTWNERRKGVKNYNVTDNIFDCADGNMIWALPPEEVPGLTVANNTYYQRPSTGINPYTEVIRKTELYATDQESLEKAIHYFDKSPKEVRWLDN